MARAYTSFRLESVAHAQGRNNGVQEDGRLRHLRLAQVFVRTCKHNIGNAISQDIIGFLKQILGKCRVFVQVFAHSYELGTLTGKYKCFHFSLFFNVLV